MNVICKRCLIPNQTSSLLLLFLTQTIDDFRNFFKPNKDRQESTLNAVLENTMKIISKSLENNNIDVTVQNRSDFLLSTYPNELMQVFLNIINNAKDALVEKEIEEPKITIVFEENEEYVIGTICDNGGGISPEVINKIGNPYITTKGEKGTGIGLHMSNIIVTKHLGGNMMWKNIDDGACFTVTFPKL